MAKNKSQSYNWVIPSTDDCATKVNNATSGNLAGLDSAGNLTDSGSEPSDFATKVSSATSGNLAGLDSAGNLTDSGSKPSDFVTSSDVTTIVVISESDYEQLTTKDANTLYYIVES